MPPDMPMPISLHSYPEAAAALKVDESWLRRHIKKLPHTKLGGRVLFTDSDLRRIIDLFHQEPGPGIRPTAIRAAGPHPLGALCPLPRSTTRRTA
ncbi:helix-turn-helix domain-containing protein [Streptantibioticus ferralitis]|uniref:Helix-turn-helix domain-containing protein n=1 Tax=Streptantibioticus ferralitis TaxID=236510 RepID=A0ABT5YUW9_9ACTN|nr:helix-turn-helix domain-containing protein [Streptantibioticus ferralitis]MDF2255402.1 helix-turn-helix domain-containing protein [Streptantibioticus ferralitis]